MAEKLAIEVLNIVYGILRNTTLFTAVGGKFFKGKKLDNFTGECVVINVLPITNDQLQTCRVNVNIHVPNLLTKIAGQPDDLSQANYPRLKELSAIARSALKAYDNGDISIRIEWEHPIDNDQFHEHYNNFRLIVRNENL